VVGKRRGTNSCPGVVCYTKIIMNQKNYGFTLIELVVAVAIMAAISVVSIQLLWDTVAARSKQYQIEGSTENIRNIVTDITGYVKEAKSINIPDAQTIEITAEVCRTIRFNAVNFRLEMAIDNSVSCIPPTSGFGYITSQEIALSKFEFSPVGFLPESVNFVVEGIYEDSLGEHQFEYNTTIIPRVDL
jgi:prepilin-type N-terminal cleavage/methylation domain-containing protein